MDWLDGWQYRKSVTLSRASGAVTNYQMKLLLGESAGAVGEDVDCGGLCLPSFNDIRFTTADGITPLSYWIETITGVTPNQLATIWIKCDSIGINATTFYMYYGNAGAAAASSGSDTFPFFDDFPGATLDNNKWSITDGATVSVSDSVVTIIGRASANSVIYSGSDYGENYAMRARVKTEHFDSASYREFGGWRDGPTSTKHALTMCCHATKKKTHYNNNAGVEAFSAILGGITAATYSIWDIIRSGGVSTVFKNNDANTVTLTSGYPTVNCGLVFEAGTSTSAKVYMDWVFIRKFLATEPAWGAWGAAEQQKLIDASLNLSAYYQKLSDFETYLRAHDGIELHDLNAELSAWGLAVEDFSGWLAAYYESIDSLGANLSTWATGYKNLAGDYDAKGQKIEAFMVYLATAKNKFKDLAMLLHAVNGIILNDMGVSLAATNGIVAKDLGMFLQALSAVPVFRSVTAHRINSVIHEVV